MAEEGSGQTQLRLGIDTGGTYTDAALVDAANQVVASGKSLTTHRQLEVGISAVLKSFLPTFFQKLRWPRCRPRSQPMPLSKAVVPRLSAASGLHCQPDRAGEAGTYRPWWSLCRAEGWSRRRRPREVATRLGYGESHHREVQEPSIGIWCFEHVQRSQSRP